jgi:hypothetical protein
MSLTIVGQERCLFMENQKGSDMNPEFDIFVLA